MFDRTYQPGGSPLLSGMTLTCESAACPSTATHERGGVRLCLGHFMHALQQEMPQHVEAECEGAA